MEKIASNISSFINPVSFQNVNVWSANSILHNNRSFREEFKLEKIGNLITRYKKRIQISNEEEYKRVKIRLYNKGILIRDKVNGSEIKTKTQFLVKSGQFIMSRIDARNGAFGIVPVELEGAIITQDFLTFDINTEKILPEFFLLLTFSKNFRELCQKTSSGTTGRQRININDFLNFKLPIPLLSIQKKISQRYENTIKEAEVLEQRIVLLKKKVSNFLLKELKLKIPNQIITKKYQLQFIDFNITNRWGVDYLTSQNSAFFINEGKYPVKKVADFLESFQYGLSEKSSKEPIGVPMLRMNNIFEGNLKLNKLKYLSKLNDATRKKFKLDKGDLLFNRTNSKELVGKTAVFNEDDEFTFASYLIRLKLNNNMVDTEYINYLFNSKISRFQIDLISRKVLGQANINSQELKEFIFPIPPLQKQKLIVKTISNLKNEIDSLKAQANLNRTTAFKEFEDSIFKAT